MHKFLARHNHQVCTYFHRCSYQERQTQPLAKHTYRFQFQEPIIAGRYCQCNQHKPLSNQDLEQEGHYPKAMVLEITCQIARLFNRKPWPSGRQNFYDNGDLGSSHERMVSHGRQWPCWRICDDVHWCSDDVDLHEESRRLGSCGDKGDGDDRNSDGSMWDYDVHHRSHQLSWACCDDPDRIVLPCSHMWPCSG